MFQLIQYAVGQQTIWLVYDGSTACQRQLRMLLQNASSLHDNTTRSHPGSRNDSITGQCSAGMPSWSKPHDVRARSLDLRASDPGAMRSVSVLAPAVPYAWLSTSYASLITTVLQVACVVTSSLTLPSFFWLRARPPPTC